MLEEASANSGVANVDLDGDALYVACPPSSLFKGSLIPGFAVKVTRMFFG